MAHQLKYILQNYALGTNTFPYYQYKIFQDSAKWNVLDGPIFLNADGDEPTTHELFESQGPIKPSSVLLNLINKRYSPAAAHEVDDDTTVLNSIDGVGGDMWAVGDSGKISYWSSSQALSLPTAQTSGTAEDLNTIDAASANKAICAGDAGTILTTANAGTTWTSRTVWSGTPIIRAITYSIASSSVIAAAGAASLGRSTDSGVNWTDFNSKIGGAGVINSLSLPTSANLFLIDGDRLKIITTFDTTPSNSSFVTAVGGFVNQVDFYDANNGVAVGISNVHLTTDGGTTWVKKGNPSATTSIDGLHYVSLDLMVIVDAVGVVLWSQDGGSNWTTITADADVTGGHLSTGGNAIHYNATRESAFEVTTLGELSKAVITDYLKEFIEIDFAEYLVTLQRSTTDFETGGGTQRYMLNQFIVDSEYGYAEDWSTPINAITKIRITDGFNIWNSLEYRTSGGALQTGRKKLTVLLGEAFELIYSGFGLTDIYSTYITFLNDNLGSDFTTAPSDATNPFVNGFVDAEYFLHEPTKPWTWWEVVSAIIGDYDSILFSPLLFIADSGGSPQIIANDRFFNTVITDQIQRLAYRTDNGAFSASASSVYVRTINSSVSVFQGEKQVREKPYQFVEATIINGRPVSLVPEGNFELEAWSSTSELNNWTRTSITIARSTTTDSDNYSEFSCNITTTSATLSAAGHIESLETSIPNGAKNLYLHIKYHCDVSSSSPATTILLNPVFYLQISAGNSFLYDGVTNKPTVEGDLSGLAWTTTESWLAISVPGDFMDTFATLPLIISTDDFPNTITGSIFVRISEPEEGDYTVNNLYIDEFFCFPIDKDGNQFSEDIRILGENTAISSGKRLDLGNLHFYDMPKVSFGDYSSATRGFSKVKFPTILNRNDGDTVAFALDTVTHTFTYMGSPGASGSKEFDTDTRLIDEMYVLSNNYYITSDLDGSQPTVTIIPFIYDTAKDAGAPAFNDAADWDNVSPDNEALVQPALTVWTNRATITDDATPTTAADWTWHAVTQEAAGTEDTEIWKLRFERELARRGLSSQFLQGTIEILAEDTDVYGGIMGLLPSGESNYKPISTRGNPFNARWESLHEKVHDESVTFIGQEVFEE